MAVLIGTVDGYHIISSSGEHRTALEGRRVEALSPGPNGTWIAIVDRNEIWQHAADGTWSALARCDERLVSLVTVDDVVYAGGVGPTMLRMDADRVLTPLPGLDSAPGRDEWHRVGSALEVRSLTATADGGALLANIHVGGIVRSHDGGESWRPTIDVEADVHEVRAHPTDPDVVLAAAAVGLCVSRDAGAHWEVFDEGLHATYARAIAFAGADILMSASDGPFATRSAIYRARVDAGAPNLEREDNGLPEWLEGNVDTRCIAASGAKLALADASGTVWAATGTTGWTRVADGLASVTAVVVV